MSVSAVSTKYMDAVVQQSIQVQSRILLDLFNVQRESVEVQAKPMKPISQAGASVDLYA